MAKDYVKEHTDNLMDGMVIAKLESHGHDFEIILEADYVNDGKPDYPDILEHMPSEVIFSDAKKGERSPSDAMIDVFGTESPKEISINILKNGDVQLTTEQRRQMAEDKRKQIVATIVRESMNPQTKTPHPPARIENAMAEIGIHIDPMKPVSVQVKEVLDLLKPVIPISFEKMKVAIKLNGTDYGRCYGDIKSVGNISHEEWGPDGSWTGMVEIPAGVQDDLFRKLNEKTKGSVETKILK